jgi:hypothetical protein
VTTRKASAGAGISAPARRASKWALRPASEAKTTTPGQVLVDERAVEQGLIGVGAADVDLDPLEAAIELPADLLLREGLDLHLGARVAPLGAEVDEVGATGGLGGADGVLEVGEGVDAPPVGGGDVEGVVDGELGADDDDCDGDGLAEPLADAAVEAEVDSAEGEAAGGEAEAGVEAPGWIKDDVAHGRPQRREEPQGHDDEADPEEALDVLHPPARAEEAGAEGDGEEERAHAEGVGEEQGAAVDDAAAFAGGLGDEGEQREQDGAGAGRRDEAADEAHEERADGAGAADGVEAGLEGDGELKVEGAEHAGGEGQEQAR